MNDSANLKIDQYFETKGNSVQQKQMQQIRVAVLSCGVELTETLKWGAPTYVAKSNVCSIAVFKNHVALWFFQGALLADHHNALHAAQETTKGLRQIHFKAEDTVDIKLIQEYVFEAAQNDLKGKKIKPAKPTQTTLPTYIKEFLVEADLLDIFHKFAPSHQKEYISYIEEAKKQETKERRMHKMAEMLKKNSSLHDKYRK